MPDLTMPDSTTPAARISRWIFEAMADAEESPLGLSRRENLISIAIALAFGLMTAFVALTAL